MKRILTISYLLFFASIYCHGQYIPISVSEKIALSNSIVEGEVIAQSTFRNEADGYIYTKNQIKLYKTLRNNNDIFTDTIDILTNGGQLDGLVESWTHLLQLQMGDYGIFFLNQANDAQQYKVFSGAQGFIRFTNHGIRGISARDVVTHYKNIRREVYDKIEQSTSSKMKILH